MRQTPTWTAAENCLLDKTRSTSIRAPWSLSCDQLSPVSYRLKSHRSSPHRAPSGPSMHPPDSPSPASPDPFPNPGLFYSEPAAPLRAWKPFHPPDLYPSVCTDTCHQTPKVAEGKLERQHGHVCLHPLGRAIIRHHVTVTAKAQLSLLTPHTETRLGTGSGKAR